MDSEVCTCDPNTPVASEQCPVHTKPQLVGVGGWLALFVFGCIIGGIARIGMSLITADYATMVASALFVITGIVLVAKHKPFAVTMARLVVAGNGLFALLPLALATARGDKRLIGLSIGNLAVAVLWFLYFTKSKRVKNTYYSA